MKNNFGRNLKFLREQKGWTTVYLAKQVGAKSDSSVTMWEKGKSYPRFDTLISLTILFNVSLDALVFGDTAILNIDPQNKKDSTLRFTSELYHYHRLVEEVEELRRRVVQLEKNRGISK